MRMYPGLCTYVYQEICDTSITASATATENPPNFSGMVHPNFVLQANAGTAVGYWILRQVKNRENGRTCTDGSLHMATSGSIADT